MKCCQLSLPGSHSVAEPQRIRDDLEGASMVYTLASSVSLLSTVAVLWEASYDTCSTRGEVMHCLCSDCSFGRRHSVVRATDKCQLADVS